MGRGAEGSKRTFYVVAPQAKEMRCARWPDDEMIPVLPFLMDHPDPPPGGGRCKQLKVLESFIIDVIHLLRLLLPRMTLRHGRGQRGGGLVTLERSD